MINLMKKLGWRIFNDRRAPADRRVEHIQGQISDYLAETSPEDFPMLTKRSDSRRS